MMNYEVNEYYSKKVFWSSVFAGVIAVIAISILLSMLATSLGFSMVEPLSDDPVNGVGSSVIVWAICILISLASGGYLAGRLVSSAGMIHGFLVWATTLIIALFFGGMLISGVLSITGSAINSMASVTGNIATGATSVMSNSFSGISDSDSTLLDNLMDKTDSKDMKDNVLRALHKSNIPSLQPEFLEKQLQEAKNDIGAAVKQMALNPDNSDSILQELIDKLKNRGETITKDVDRNSLVKVLSDNTSYSQSEINQIADNIINAKNKAAAQFNEQLNNVQQGLEQFKQQALVTADQTTSTLAKSSLVAFFSLLLGCIVSSIAGAYGARKNRINIPH